MRLPDKEIQELTQQLVDSSRWQYEPEYAEALVRRIAGYQYDYFLTELEAIKDLPTGCWNDRPCEMAVLIEDMKGE